MKIFRTLIALLLTLTLIACGQPVPPDKAAYVGEWQGLAMSLLITQDGSVAYRRLEGGVNKSIDAPLKAFEGNDFIVGVGPMKTKFVVSVPPHAEGDTWQMTVDGVVLTKVQ